MWESFYYIFPFGNVEKNESVILWGLGVVGKQYVEQIKKTNYCNILFVADKEWNKKEGYNEIILKSPEEIKNYRNEKIIISVLDKQIATMIQETLLDWGVSKERIIHCCKMCTICTGIEKLLLDSAMRIEEQEKYLERVIISIENLLLDNKYKKENIYLYEKKQIKKIHALLHVMNVKNKKIIRIGNKNDGGYLMVDDFLENGGTAYSFGVSSDVSWDKEMAGYHYDIYMYDHTINELPEQNTHFHFEKMGIASAINEVGEYLNTLNYFLKKNNHQDEERMILKMDVEGAEYGFLEMTDSSVLNQFDQIVMELHFITSVEKSDEIIKALTKLNVTHQLVHVHGNNYSKIKYINGHSIPDSLEVLYVKRSICQFYEKEEIRPFELDSPCWIERNEVFLGNWNGYDL